MSTLPKLSTDSPLPNIYISCVFWLPAEKCLLRVNYSSLEAFYLQRRICSTHESASFPAEINFQTKVVRLSVAAGTAAMN